MNTAPQGDDAGDVWINPSGAVGQGSYSTERLTANRWYRIVFSADLTRGERKYYIDGRLVHRQTGDRLDGRFSLKVPEEPFFTLFADSDGKSSPIDAQQVAFWNYTMPDSAVSALGGPAVRIVQPPAAATQPPAAVTQPPAGVPQAPAGGTIRDLLGGGSR